MLSKSKFIGGLQCEKRLWLEKHQPELRDPVSDAQQALFSQGTRVGELAQTLFPGGVDCTPDFTRADRKGITIGLNKTKEAVRNGADVIYEAAFVADGVYAAMDILVREGKKWRAIEVKSSTSVKGYHIYDVALQYYVLTQAGIDLVDIELMHINNEYERQGDVDVNRLFHRASLLEEVRPLQSEIPDKLRIFLDLLQQDTAPEVGIGPHCSEPFDCPFKGHCWGHVPNPSVFDLTRIGSNAWKMYEEGLLAIEDVPEDYTLTNKQRNQVEGVQKDKEVFNAEAIAEFLGEWKFPLYFFDFETIGPAVPLYDKSRPYEQLPFQYSLHILSKPDAELKHVEFLADPEAGDPRQALITQMLSDLKKRGSIVTYNMGFEKGKIAALANAFPEHREALLAINERIVDLIIPFRSHWCYHPAMRGSASIKAVLPALTNLSYDDLTIKDGATASDTWQAMAERKFSGNPNEKMEALRKYCEMDTLAMVEIWKVLRARVFG